MSTVNLTHPYSDMPYESQIESRCDRSLRKARKIRGETKGWCKQFMLTPMPVSVPLVFDAPWLTFEAGVLLKTINKSFVSPFL